MGLPHEQPLPLPLCCRHEQFARPRPPPEGHPPVDAILGLTTASHPDEPHMMAIIQNAQYMQTQFAK